MGAALSACRDPKVEPLCGVVVAEAGSPSLPKTDPLVVVVVVVGLVFVDVVLIDAAAPLPFS